MVIGRCNVGMFILIRKNRTKLGGGFQRCTIHAVFVCPLLSQWVDHINAHEISQHPHLAVLYYVVWYKCILYVLFSLTTLIVMVVVIWFNVIWRLQKHVLRRFLLIFVPPWTVFLSIIRCGYDFTNTAQFWYISTTR